MTLGVLSEHEKNMLLIWVTATHPDEVELARQLPCETVQSLYLHLPPAGDDYDLLLRLRNKLVAEHKSAEGATRFFEAAKDFGDLRYVRRAEPIKHFFESLMFERLQEHDILSIAVDHIAYKAYRANSHSMSLLHKFYGTITSALIYHDVDEVTLKDIRVFVRKYLDESST